MKKHLLFFLASLNMMLYAGTKPSVGFIENKGQIHDQNFKTNSEVKYLLSIPGMNVQLKSNSFSYDTYLVEQKNTETTRETALTKLKHPKTENTYHFHRVDVEFIGASVQPEIIAENPSETYYNYYTTGTSEQGVTNVRSYEKVTYKNIYPNIDLEFIAKEGKMKYNFILHYGADMNVIKWKYHGANTTEIKSNNIYINVKQGQFYESIPESYLASNSKRIKPVKIDFIKDSNGNFGFNCANKNAISKNQDLIIDPDPIVLWSTYFGGSSLDELYSALDDSLASIYVAGWGSSTNAIATTGAFQTTYGGGTYDGVIGKFTKSGTLKWATYYGGTGEDYSYCIVMDKSYKLFVSGITGSSGVMATSGTHQSTYGGGSFDAYLVKFDTNGVRQWGTYYGGTGSEYVDWGKSCVMDNLGNVYLCGATSSSNAIATVGAYQTVNGGGPSDNFIVKFNNNGVRQWGTYHGGGGDDQVFACETDKNNNIYISGVTTSSNGISTAGSHQQSFSGGTKYDAYLAKFSTTGLLKLATYYGGSDGNDRGIFMHYDNIGNNIYLTGDTESTDSIASTGSHQALFGGIQDGFLAKFDTNCVRQWGTYYGGAGWDYFLSVTTDNNNVYLGGASQSPSGISTLGVWQPTCNCGPYGDAILIKFNKNGVRQWGTYFVGSFWEAIFSTIVTAGGDIYAVGATSSNNIYVTAGVHQTTFGGWSGDGFVTKFRQNATTNVIEQFTENESILMYPNPNSGSFTIQTKEDVVLEIVNELGQLVKTVKLDTNNNHQTTITGLADGVYCLKDKLSGSVIKNKIVVVR